MLSGLCKSISSTMLFGLCKSISFTMLSGLSLICIWCYHDIRSSYPAFNYYARQLKKPLHPRRLCLPLNSLSGSRPFVQKPSRWVGFLFNLNPHWLDHLLSRRRPLGPTLKRIYRPELQHEGLFVPPPINCNSPPSLSKILQLPQFKIIVCPPPSFSDERFFTKYL